MSANIFYPTLTQDQVQTVASKGRVLKRRWGDGSDRISSLKDYQKQEGRKVAITNCLKSMAKDSQPTEFQPIISHAQIFKGTVIYYLNNYGMTSWTIEVPLGKAKKLGLPTE